MMDINKYGIAWWSVIMFLYVQDFKGVQGYGEVLGCQQFTWV